MGPETTRRVLRIHVLQHVPFEGLGSIKRWTTARAAEVTWTRFFETPILPDPATLDLVIALGGPMSVNDERELPWLAAEKRFIAAAIGLGKPVLGICLGAQLIASALGARVYRASQKEIGWFPVQGARVAGRCFALPEVCNVFHWHGETFDLPTGAIRLAGSAVCGNQAFQLGERVIALQFHLETTPESLELMIGNCGAELIPGQFVQTAPQMRRADPAMYLQNRALMGRLLDYLVAQPPGTKVSG